MGCGASTASATSEAVGLQTQAAKSFDAGEVADTHNLPFPKEGVLLRVFDEFIEACGGDATLRGLTTTDVCQKFLMPMTAQRAVTRAEDDDENNDDETDSATEKGTSYCLHLLSKGHEGVGKAVVFISHAWKYHFLDVVSALKAHFRDSNDVYIWFDLFSNNQHRASALPFEWWSTTFSQAIRDFGHTVMVLAPWSDPVPLTRAWCLFELFQTATTGSKFEVAMSKAEFDNFWVQLNQKTYEEMVSNIDLERSDSFNPDDKERIFQVVRAMDGGFDGLNSKALETIRSWVIRVAQEKQADTKSHLQALESSSGSPQGLAGEISEEVRKAQLEVADGDFRIGEVMFAAGKTQLAKSYFLAAVGTRTSLLGSDHPDTLLSRRGLTCVDGSTSSKLTAAQEILAVQRRAIGIENPAALTTLQFVGNIHFKLKQYQAAVEAWEECLEWRIKVLPENHPDIVTTKGTLAGGYLETKKNDAAIKLLKEVLDSRREVFGQSHPKTLSCLRNYGVAVGRLGNWEKSCELLLEASRLLRIKVGDAHNDTVSACKVLMQALRRGKLKDKYSEMYSEFKGSKELAKRLELDSPEQIIWTT